MSDRIVEPKEGDHIPDNVASKQLTTYMMLGQMLNDQLVKEGKRAPDDPQLQLTGEGWRVWGGNVQEPLSKTVAEVYLGVLENGTIEEAQEVLDMTRKRCKELRMTFINLKGNQSKELEGKWSKLKDELAEAVEIKKERGISSVQI